jgi:hypothetical protein
MTILQRVSLFGKIHSQVIYYLKACSKLNRMIYDASYSCSCIIFYDHSTETRFRKNRKNDKRKHPILRTNPPPPRNKHQLNLQGTKIGYTK